MSSYISPHPLVCGAWESQRRARACQSGRVSLDLLPSWRHVPRGRGGGAVVRASCSRREVLWKPVKRQGQGKLLPLCHIQIQRCLAERHGGAGEYLVRRRSGQRGRSVPELHPHTHRWRPADPLLHLHNAPLSRAAVLFCLFAFPFGSKRSRGDEIEIFLWGGRVVRVHRVSPPRC